MGGGLRERQADKSHSRRLALRECHFSRRHSVFLSEEQPRAGRELGNPRRGETFPAPCTWRVLAACFPLQPLCHLPGQAGAGFGPAVPRRALSRPQFRAAPNLTVIRASPPGKSLPGSEIFSAQIEGLPQITRSLLKWQVGVVKIFVIWRVELIGSESNDVFGALQAPATFLAVGS